MEGSVVAAASFAGRGAWVWTSVIRQARHEHSGIETPVWVQRVMMGALVPRTGLREAEI